MEIIVVSGDRADGGSTAFALRIAGSLARDGHDVGVLTTDEPSRTDVARVTRGSGPFIPSAAAAVRRASGADSGPLFVAVGWDAALAAVLGRPTGSASRIHFVPDPDRPDSVPPRFVRSWILSRVDRVHPVGRSACRAVHELGIDADRVDPLGYATDPSAWSPDDGRSVRRSLRLGSRPVVLTLADADGALPVVRALPDVLSEHPRALLLVHGAPDRHGPVLASARELGIETAIRFADPPPAGAPYPAADLFAWTPATDAFDPVPYLDAGACRLPVVASRTGDGPDVVRDGATGLVVDPTDADAVGAAVLFFLGAPGLSRDFGEAGRRHVLDRASWDRVAPRLVRV